MCVRRLRSLLCRDRARLCRDRLSPRKACRVRRAALRQFQRARLSDPSGYGRRVSRIDSIDEIVFIAGFVLDKKDVLAIATPKVCRNRARGVRGNRLCLVERFFGAFDPDVARAFERFDKSNELAIGRNLRTGDLGVAEEEFAIDYGRQTIWLS